jgi:hypothetical protein
MDILVIGGKNLIYWLGKKICHPATPLKKDSPAFQKSLGVVEHAHCNPDGSTGVSGLKTNSVLKVLEKPLKNP